MQQDKFNKIKNLAKDEKSAQELYSLLNDVENKKDEIESHLNLLERAISNDYDSILITELSLELPGPKIVYVNDGFTKLTGYSKEEAIGQTPRILQGPKTERATLDRLKTCLIEGKSFFGQAVNYRKDGSEFINQWDIHPLFNEAGTITHWVSYQHDITKRKTAEATFNETEIEFDNLIEYSKRTLIDIDLNGKIIQANKAFRTLTGFDNAELSNHSFIEFVDTNDVVVFKDVLKHPSAIEKREFTLKTKNHIPIQVEIENELHPLKSGELIRLTVHNVSMQKQVLKTLEERLFNGDSLMHKKSEFTYEIQFDSNSVPHFTYLSDGFESLTGFAKEDFLKPKSWHKLISSQDHPKGIAYFDKVMHGEEQVESFDLIHANGSRISVLNYAQLDRKSVV